MASGNETVAEIVKEIRTIPWKVYNQEIESNDDCGISQSYCNVLADRIEAAHKREVSELKNKCEEYERQSELTAETAKVALELLKTQESKIKELRKQARTVIGI